MPNQLQYEKSPYLLQHKDNPVDWYPWGDEAFRLAKKENKPVFLSIGYATCHWCHVMEHESFEDEEIASSLNDAFINIKVDREERPDIDSTYMTVCQMLNGHGGWPLTLILTPDKEPFFASTYIPKDARSGRIGLRQLIPGVTGMWKHKPEQVSKAVESIKEGYARSQEFKPGDLPGTEALDYAAEQLAARFDDTYGGFGNAPKFPTPHNLMFLLRHWKETGDERFLDAVNQTLTRMRMGGIWDHIGFGFHRYSTDREWLLPHFEKMLYDQALLMQAYTEAWQATKDPLFKQTAYDIAEYVFRDLQGDTPAFYSAEDADSEGEEGKFYVWEMGETAKMLSKEDQAFFAKVFGIKEEGNFEDEATGQLTGKNIAHLSEPLSGKDTEPWERIREQLFKARTTRVRPLLDDKILTDWNALMISALAKAGAAFSDPELINKAAEAFQFIKEKLFIGETLYHRFKEDDTAIPGFADDHAFLIQAAIDLYQSTFDAGYLEFAIDLQKIFDEHFHDSSSGGYFFSRDSGELPLGNQKQIYDGAVPSANSVTMNNLIRLSRITGDVSFEEKANQTAKCFSADLIRSGSSITVGMMSLQMIYNDPVEVIIAEGPDAGNTNAFVEYFSREFIPNKVLLLRPESEKDRIYELSDYISRNQPVEGKTTIYICRNYSCEKPVVDLIALKELI